ncbi:uncharacterized protein LOC111864570 [Cryptotermes secundus]|uniref:uncharacterized protein LOC111864570 n=1 Tax=Cryptotermes secundus TaxID=105785 RepID=UPI000CD7BD66|nr:uncharacterized protein LOC111864570 [Cryptotermes secundus]
MTTTVHFNLNVLHKSCIQVCSLAPWRPPPNNDPIPTMAHLLLPITVAQPSKSHLDSEAVEQLLLFSQQISTDGIAFTAAGFFVIDLSLLCTVLTSAVTYVIILIQFKSH